MTPYYQDEAAGITLYCGDARDILPQLPPVDVIITDPVWPNAIPELAGSDDPYGLFAAAAEHFPRLADRVVVQLGCDSDPRFLAAVPACLPFFRVCWLEYALPHYKGRLLYTGDVAYVYGSPPPWRRGAGVLPGRIISHRTEAHGTHGHPSPRKAEHVRWLVNWFARGTVLDPFLGSGTTAAAAKACGYPFIGIEISEDYCRLAVERLRQDVFRFEEVP
jgi:hypothetical protein